MSDGTLIIGYGNVLRTDDGVGRRAAELLAEDPRVGDATVLGCHQLTPELALDASAAGLLILVDASPDLPAGSFAVVPARPTGTRQSGISHQVSPAGLLDLALELYGRMPQAIVVHVGVSSFEYGDRLSPDVAAAMPRLVDEIVALAIHRCETYPGEMVAVARDA